MVTTQGACFMPGHEPYKWSANDSFRVSKKGLLCGRGKKCDPLRRSPYFGSAEVFQLAVFGDLGELQAAIAQVADEHAHRGGTWDALDAARLRGARQPVE